MDTCSPAAQAYARYLESLSQALQHHDFAVQTFVSLAFIVPREPLPAQTLVSVWKTLMADVQLDRALLLADQRTEQDMRIHVPHRSMRCFLTQADRSAVDAFVPPVAVIATCHRELARHLESVYEKIAAKDWDMVLGSEERYACAHCLYHWIQARDHQKASAWLLDFQKLFRLVSQHVAEGKTRRMLRDVQSVESRDVRFTQRAVMLALRALEIDARMLAGQIVARLDGIDARLVHQAWAWVHRARTELTIYMPYPGHSGYERARGREILHGHSAELTCLQVSGTLLCTGSEDSTVRIWDIDSGRCIHVLQGHTRGVGCILVSGNKIFTGSDDKTARIWDMDSGKLQATLQGHLHWIICIAVSGTKLFTGSVDATVRIWDIESGMCMHVLQGHNRIITCLAAVSGTRVISGSDDNTAKIWDVKSGVCLHTLEGHRNYIISGIRCITICGTNVFTGAADFTVRLWDIESGKMLNSFEGHRSEVRCMTVSGTKLFTGSDDSNARIWDIPSGSCIHVLQGHTNTIKCIAVAAINVFTGSVDLTIRIWDIQSGNCFHTLQLYTEPISCLAVYAGKIFAGSLDATVRIWEVECPSEDEGETKSDWKSGNDEISVDINMLTTGENRIPCPRDKCVVHGNADVGFYEDTASLDLYLADRTVYGCQAGEYVIWQR